MSPRRSPDRIGFRRSDPAALIAVVAAALDGGGWVNVQADPDDVDPRASQRPSLFSGRGRAAPLATLVVGPAGGEHQVGFEHGAGRRAGELLREAGIELPAGARLLSDHPRRGLVLAVPAGSSAEALALLLLRAASALTTVPLGDRWIAEHYPG